MEKDSMEKTVKKKSDVPRHAKPNRILDLKHELSNLAQTQRVAHHTYEQLVHRLKGEREENLKSITGIHDLVKSIVRNGDEEPSKANMQDLTTRLQEDRVKRDLGMEELRRRLDGVTSTAEQQRKNLERVKNDFYKAQVKTYAKTNDLSRDIQDQTSKVDILEKKTIKGELNALEDDVRDIDELKQEVYGFKETVIVSKKDIERDIDALKTGLKLQAEDQRKLEKKVNSQYQDAKGYMQDTLAEVSKIDLRLKDLERTNPPFKAVNNHTEVHDNQDDTVLGDEVVISTATVMWNLSSLHLNALENLCHCLAMVPLRGRRRKGNVPSETTTTVTKGIASTPKHIPHLDATTLDPSVMFIGASSEEISWASVAR
ncbi:MAG: hypothetical protein Q9180_005051, partial [Flavoplaca navasiana]